MPQEGSATDVNLVQHFVTAAALRQRLYPEVQDVPGEVVHMRSIYLAEVAVVMLPYEQPGRLLHGLQVQFAALHDEVFVFAMLRLKSAMQARWCISNSQQQCLPLTVYAPGDCLADSCAKPHGIQHYRTA